MKLQREKAILRPIELVRKVCDADSDRVNNPSLLSREDRKGRQGMVWTTL